MQNQPNIMLDFHLSKIEGTARNLAVLGSDWSTVLAVLTDMTVDEQDPIYSAALRGYTNGLATVAA